MTNFFLEDAAGDLDLFLALTERGAGDHHHHSQATGEHAVAAVERVVGADRLAALLRATQRAAGDGVVATFRTLGHANPGREWALRSSAVDLTVYCPEGDADQLRTVANQFNPGVDIATSRGRSELTIKYLSAHPTSNARQEAETALRDAGIPLETEGNT